MLSMVSPSSRYPTPTGISANVSSTSSFVTANPVNPFTRTAYRTTTASNQPQRLGRPVVAPNSPPSSRIRCATAGAASVGSGPLPTRVVYAFTTPRTASIAVPHASAPVLVFISRPDAPPCRPDLVFPLTGAIEELVIGERQMRALGDVQLVLGTDSACRQRIELGEQLLGIEHHAVADDADRALKNSRWYLVQDE